MLILNSSFQPTFLLIYLIKLQKIIFGWILYFNNYSSQSKLFCSPIIVHDCRHHGKLNKFISDNTLLNQEWIMEPKKRVKDIIKEVAGPEKIIVRKFTRFRVGEGI
jgi:hypothetical protein